MSTFTPLTFSNRVEKVTIFGTRWNWPPSVLGKTIMYEIRDTKDQIIVQVESFVVSQPIHKNIYDDAWYILVETTN